MAHISSNGRIQFCIQIIFNIDLCKFQLSSSEIHVIQNESHYLFGSVHSISGVIITNPKIRLPLISSNL